MSILLILLLSSSAAVATINHEDRRQAFRPAAERLPEELDDLIWAFYPELKYGDNPESPIFSLEETQAQVLFPPLHFKRHYTNAVYESDRLNQTMTKDRYLTLYVTAESNNSERYNINDGELLFKTDFNCEIEMRYFVANGTVQQWSDEAGLYSDLYDGGYRSTIDMSRLNEALEPGTEILLYIPQGCTLTLLKMGRAIFNPLNIRPKGICSNISWTTSADNLPTRSTSPSQEKRSFISVITEWVKQTIY